jgi:hypothetical protein
MELNFYSDVSQLQVKIVWNILITKVGSARYHINFVL